jgi:fibronectin-binding autotransporter adhesin
MRNSKRALLAAAAAASVSIIGRSAHATNYTWNDLAGGTQSWTDTTQWNPTGNPTGALGAGDGANLNVALTSNLSINIPTGTYFVGSMQLGSTSTPVTTDVGNANSGGGTIAFDGGAPNPNVYADILSTGVAGSTNIISAPIQLDQTAFCTQNITSGVTTAGNYLVNAIGSVQSQPLQPVVTGLFASVVIDKNSTSDLTLNGPISQIPGVFAGICNTMPVGRTLTLNGGIALSSVASGTVAQTMYFGGNTGSLTVINGVISDGGTVANGPTYGYTNPSKESVYPAITPTIQINSANTYTGITTINMSTIIVGNNQAFSTQTAGLTPPQSTGEVRLGGSASQFGYNIEAANDSITINNGVDVTQFLTVEGSHSITFNGYLYQTTARAIENLLPAGKTLTLNGPIWENTTKTNAFGFDGSGLTVVNGSIHNSTTADTSTNAPLNKAGTGAVLLEGTGSTYNGATTVNGGLLEFAAPGAYGVQTGDSGTSSITVNAGGAVALDSNAGGTAGTTDSSFLNLIASASTGGLALSSLDAPTNLDFTTGKLGTLSSMSVGSDYAGVTYTGTITPGNSTYRLGGGGTLTLANSGGNALTGAGNSLIVTNGGTIAVNGSNNYGGATTIQGIYLTTDQVRAAQNDFTAPTGAFESATLSVNNLAPGGSASGIGSSSNAASNLVINGGTLQYTGSGASTDRLFTMNPNGATLDSSGTGAVDFTNTLAITQVDQAPMTGVTVTAVSGAIVFNKLTLPGGTSTSNLSVGMTIHDSAGAFPASTVVGVTSNAIFLSNNITSTQSNDTLTFGNENRTLTLTGTNTGLNILSAAVTDSTLGTLAVNKTGSGRWVVSGNNTYTGGTTVSAGTLTMGTATAIPGNVSVASGATLQLGTSIGGVQFTTSNLTIASGGTLDVNNDHVFISYGAGPDPIASIAAMLASGYNGGAWNGVGINSSAVAGNPGYGVGYADSADTGNPASLPSGTIEVAFTLLGDANLDKAVNGVDFGILAANFNKGITGWDKGDFNYDNAVNGVDFGFLAANFNKGAAAASDLAALDAFAAANGLLADVPEPVSASILGIGAAGLMARRRRRQ